MDKKFLILQFRTDQSLEHEKQCFKKALNLHEKNLTFFNVFDNNNNNFNLVLKNYNALIISGSGQFNVTDLPKDKREKIKKISGLIRQAIKTDFPTLGICFGHQLIAELCGGKVKRDEAQFESGTQQIVLNKLGQGQKIFKNFPKKFFAAQGHKDSVVKLPKNAVKLAYSKKTDIQAYKIGDNIFTVQFHPEFELEDMMFRLALYPEYLKGKSMEDIRKEHKEIPHAIKVLKNFVSLI